METKTMTRQWWWWWQEDDVDDNDDADDDGDSIFFVIIEGRWWQQQDEQAMLYVDLEYATTFYQAEEYHQNYVTKQIEAAKRQRFLWLNNQVPSGLYPIIEAE